LTAIFSINFYNIDRIKPVGKMAGRQNTLPSPPLPRAGGGSTSILDSGINAPHPPTLNLRAFTQRIHQRFQQIITDDDHRAIYGHRECNICLDEFDPNAISVSLIKPCNHISHEICLAQAFVSSTAQTLARCPNCRSDVREIITIHSIDNFTTETPEDFIQRVLPGNQISNSLQMQRRPTFQTPFPRSQRQRVDFGLSFPQLNYGNSGELLRSIPIREILQVNGPTSMEQVPIDQIIALRQEIMDSQFFGYNTGTLFMSHANSSEEIVNSDTIYVLDISGSMRPVLPDLKQVLVNIITNINSLQRVSLILFDHDAYHLFELQQITIENRASIIAKINLIITGGSTNFNPPFSLLENALIDGEETGPGRKKIVVFLSDGANDDRLDTDLLDNIFTRFPELSMNTLSYGSGINANQSLIPILRDRRPEHGKYYHLATSVDFDRVIREINGDNSDTYARNLSICFSGAKPISSDIITNEDGTFTVILPSLNTNSEIMIPYFLIGGEIRISYSYTLADGSVSTGLFSQDDANILPEVLTKFFPRKSLVSQRIIEITSNSELNDTAKHTRLNELLDLILPSTLGDFYGELTAEINRIVRSYTHRDNDTQNYATQGLRQLTTGGTPIGLARTASSVVRRTQTQTQTSPDTVMEEDV
jgi:hypothetical protein